jgi:hypothetical protein
MTWAPPTRRAFAKLLGLGALALATVSAPKVATRATRAPRADDEPVAPTLWIGHC